MFAIEYFCPACKARHKGRFFKKPDLDDLERAEEAERMLARLNLRFVPEESIPGGDETDRLLRWGYRRFRDMFNSRQLFGLEISCQLIADQPNERVRHALATNLSDLLRYQNMLCRYDTMALKSLDIFSVHGFPVGLVQCESNLLGIPTAGETSIGSGGWSNIIGKYTKAKAYCDEPFEFRHDGRQKTLVKLAGEWIGERRDGLFEEAQRTVDLRCGDSAEAELSPESLDAIFTDPPYFGNVQYAELMDFCYVWLRQFAGDATLHFLEGTTKNDQELTGNASMNRGIEHFTGGLSRVFQKMATALRPGRPLAFTYHHNKLDAYRPIAVAILDSGLACTAALPCPAEMGASIHINGTGSSIVDTVFVCRKPPLPAELLDGEPRTISELVATDRDLLTKGGVKVTAGDERCVGFGHITRAAICSLASSWDPSASIEARLERVERAITDAEAHAVSRESNAESVEHSEHVAAATPLRTALI